MDIDIVIPTTNNFSEKGFSIYFTIRSILAQSYQPKNILIVENGMEKTNTATNLVDEFGEMVTIIDGTGQPNNISYARNIGSQHGRSELILFIDDDVVIARTDTLEKIIKKMAGIDFYCGAHRYWTNTAWQNLLKKSFSINHMQRILMFKSYLPKSIERISGSQSFHEYSFIGHFGAVKRTVFAKIGGFDEQYIGWSYQDTDLMMRLCMNNFRYDLMHSDGISIFHLSHPVDKSNTAAINRKRFVLKQQSAGIEFHLNHFFGIFDDDGYSILT